MMMYVGSSPLARGLPLSSLCSCAHNGIIPARAGFTDEALVGIRYSSDHPRSRGVYVVNWLVYTAWPGSSPLARGLRREFQDCLRPRGIIPARAGFTPGRTSWSLCARDHPRSRGVYGLRPAAAEFMAGSSPLARGLLIAAWRQTFTNGIIPARAGFTLSKHGDEPNDADHPRSRGVYHATAVALYRELGSSPLARGLPRLPIGQVVVNRIIPARAGFTRRGRPPP